MRKNDKPIKDVINAFLLQSSKISAGLASEKIEEIYKVVVGETVASYTSSVSLKKDTLVVSVKSSPLRSELTHSREKLMTMLNEALGEDIIKNISIR